MSPTPTISVKRRLSSPNVALTGGNNLFYIDNWVLCTCHEIQWFLGIRTQRAFLAKQLEFSPLMHLCCRYKN